MAKRIRAWCHGMPSSDFSDHGDRDSNFWELMLAAKARSKLRKMPFTRRVRILKDWRNDLKLDKKLDKLRKMPFTRRVRNAKEEAKWDEARATWAALRALRVGGVGGVTPAEERPQMPLSEICRPLAAISGRRA